MRLHEACVSKRADCYAERLSNLAVTEMAENSAVKLRYIKFHKNHLSGSIVVLYVYMDKAILI
jgi:hypothetical protein